MFYTKGALESYSSGTELLSLSREDSSVESCVDGRKGPEALTAFRLSLVFLSLMSSLSGGSTVLALRQTNALNTVEKYGSHHVEKNG